MDKKLQHIAIIPDGNRRWAKENGLPAFEGHRKGAENFDALLRAARDLNIKYLSSWVFSTENWKRTDDEKAYLFTLIRDLVQKNKEKFITEKARFVHIGRKDRLPKDIIEMIKDIEDSTKEFTEFTFILGIDYGGHDEILRALEKIKKAGLEVTEENVEANLDTAGFPPPDLIIRTSGEQRLSGFMSWQSEYAEFYFPKIHYPDFGPTELKKAIDDFNNRERRFGGNSA